MLLQRDKVQQQPQAALLKKSLLRLLFLQSDLSASERERVRQWIVSLIFTVYWLLIFEGALRKWALPEMHNILFFIRDPFVFATYFLTVKYKMWPRPSFIFKVGLALGVAFFALALIQSLVFEVSPLIVIYGWRNYFFYLPFAFIIGEHFRGRDLKRLIGHTLLMAIPLALLCYRQFQADPTDVINQSYTPGYKAMLVARNIVRTSGTFTISTSQANFVGSALAMLFAVWLVPAGQRPFGRIVLWLSSFAVLTMLAVSGARSAFVLSIPIIVAAMVSVIVAGGFKPNLRTLLITPTLVCAGLIGFVTIFPTAFSAMVEREMLCQAAGGSIWGRIVSFVPSFLDAWPSISLLGAGLGRGSNAGAVLASGSANMILGEDEWGRVVLEAGVLGVFYLAFRVWLVIWLLRYAVLATRRSQNPLPLVLFGFAFVNLLIGQMALQGTINGYGWIFAGFCIAANRMRTRVLKQSKEAENRRGENVKNKVDLWC